MADLARQNSQNAQQLEDLENQLKVVKSDYKAKIDGAKAEMNRIHNLVSSGYNMIEEEALVVFHPKEKIKKFYSRPVPFKEGEVGEFIREEPMQPSDFQKPLPLPDPEKDDGAEPGKGFEPTVLSAEDAEKLEDKHDNLAGAGSDEE